MKKNIKIVYQPGFGGHFLTLLFSLDPSVSPHIIDTDDINKRLEYYNFNHHKKFESWGKFHSYHGRAIRRNSDQTCITYVHPHEFVYAPDVSYFIVDLSYDSFSNYWLMGTKENWGGFPSLRIGEFEREQMIKETYNMCSISIDLFLDQSQWKTEYIKISELMSVPIHLEQAEVLYNSWYQVRVLPLKNDFYQLSHAQQHSYLEKRKQLENRIT